MDATATEIHSPEAPQSPKLESLVGYWKDRRTVGVNSAPIITNPDNLLQQAGQEQGRIAGNFLLYFVGPRPVWLTPNTFTHAGTEVAKVFENRFPFQKPVEVISAPPTPIPRSCASVEGDKILLSADPRDQNIRETVTHEVIHCYLSQAMGISKSASVVEGAAMYFANKIHPGGTENDYMSRDKKLLDLAYQKGHLPGLSHTQMVELAYGGRISEDWVREESYMFGGFLTQFVVERYGLDKFLQFYEGTSRKNLFDSSTGKMLIKDDMLYLQERELIGYCLGRIGTNVDQFANEFSKFLQVQRRQK